MHSCGAASNLAVLQDPGSKGERRRWASGVQDNKGNGKSFLRLKSDNQSREGTLQESGIRQTHGGEKRRTMSQTTEYTAKNMETLLRTALKWGSLLNSMIAARKEDTKERIRAPHSPNSRTEAFTKRHAKKKKFGL